MSDLISRQDAIDMKFSHGITEDGLLYVPYREVKTNLEELPSAQPDGWLEQNKDKILQAGMEGREVEFRIGGRLFAIREMAQ